MMSRFINWVRRRKEVEKPEELEANEDVKIFSRNQLAEALGMFPYDVEKTLIELQKKGIIECHMYQGELYAIVPIDFDIDKALIDKDLPMFG